MLTRPLESHPAPAPRTDSIASRRRAGRLAALLVLAVVLLPAIPAVAASDVVSLEVARAEFEAGRALLIDIREPEEHATGVAHGAHLLPMRQLNRRLNEIPTTPNQPVLLICNTQNRSSAVLRALRDRGYANVRYVHGGMSEWARRGWPMVKPAVRTGG